MGEPHGDRLLEWVTSPEFRAQQVRYRRMHTFSRVAVDEYVPEGGVQRADFTEPLDGCQRLIFFFRSLYYAIKELLKKTLCLFPSTWGGIRSKVSTKYKVSLV